MKKTNYINFIVCECETVKHDKTTNEGKNKKL